MTSRIWNGRKWKSRPDGGWQTQQTVPLYIWTDLESKLFEAKDDAEEFDSVLNILKEQSIVFEGELILLTTRESLLSKLFNSNTRTLVVVVSVVQYKEMSK